MLRTLLFGLTLVLMLVIVPSALAHQAEIEQHLGLAKQGGQTGLQHLDLAQTYNTVDDVKTHTKIGLDNSQVFKQHAELALTFASDDPAALAQIQQALSNADQAINHAQLALNQTDVAGAKNHSQIAGNFLRQAMANADAALQAAAAQPAPGLPKAGGPRWATGRHWCPRQEKTAEDP